MPRRWSGSRISANAAKAYSQSDFSVNPSPGVWSLQQLSAYRAVRMWPLAQTRYTLYSWGGNKYNALGTARNNSDLAVTTISKNYPSKVFVSISDQDSWTSVDGNSHGAGVKANGTLWTWGRNRSGQLGLGTVTTYTDTGAPYYTPIYATNLNLSSPVQVGALTNWASVSCGTGHTAAIKTNGTLWTWGDGTNGRLGKGNTTSYSSPVQVGALTTWASVSCGDTTTLAIKTDGTLWSWGAGTNGKLGLGNTTSYSSPKQVGALTNWSKVSASSYHVLAVKTDGTLWSWGLGTNGRLGLGNQTAYSSPKQVGALTTWASVSSRPSPSSLSSAAIKTDGTLWTWGYNTNGILGLGNTTSYSSPKQVGALTNWSKVSVTRGHMLATKTDGTLWSWGAGTNGKLGLGNTTSYSSPKQVGTSINWKTPVASVSCSFALKGI